MTWVYHLISHQRVKFDKIHSLISLHCAQNAASRINYTRLTLFAVSTKIPAHIFVEHLEWLVPWFAMRSEIYNTVEKILFERCYLSHFSGIQSIIRGLSSPHCCIVGKQHGVIWTPSYVCFAPGQYGFTNLFNTQHARLCVCVSSALSLQPKQNSNRH